MKAVIYARFSSDRQREESIEGQLRECHEYARSNGITIINEYVDRALSASKETEKRLEFLRMIRDSGKGLFDIVLVWKLDRFARNRYDSAHYKAALKKNGVKVVSATEHIADGPEGIRVFKTAIPDTVKVGDAISRGLTVMEYAPESKASAAYRAFAKEVDELYAAQYAPAERRALHGRPDCGVHRAG